MATESSLKPRRSHKKQVRPVAASERFDIPYFAHEPLDPRKFPEEIGAPVGRPPYWCEEGTGDGSGHGAWEDSDETDIGEPDGDYSAKSSKKKTNANSLKQSSISSYKNMRVAGGRPAIAKRVTADLDSDDELIVRMKNAKYLEKDIADRLIQEGRTKYNPKTIGTRWARLKRALQQAQEEKLDDELTDWHDGDDDVLDKAIQKAEADIEKAKKDADDKKWRIVADYMKTMKPVVNFSKKACQDRFNARQAGIAKPTPESIQNPDESVLARIRSRAEKEQRIRDDATQLGLNAENEERNPWGPSRMRTIY